jgi:predicted enzyme related to lactoylglutathione lyase
MPRVVHFEIHAQEPERAVHFYRQVFGWEITKWDGPVDYWLIKTGAAPEPGIDGGLIRRQGPNPVDGQAVIAYVCTVQVPSVDDYTDRITAAGGVIVVPKMAIPGVGWLVYAKDPDGNIFGIMQSDPQAK